MSDVKLCKDCAHYLESKLGDGTTDRCANARMATSARDLVRGGLPQYQFCENQRGDFTGACGRDARYFRLKMTAPGEREE